MAKIDETVINEILANTDIVDLISEKVALSKKGKSYFGLCPFHHEKTPSFSVEPERKIYNCFSCGEKGNAITFLQKTENQTFVEAIEVLADRANMAIDFTEYKQVSPNRKYYSINAAANSFYHLYLSNTAFGENALNYLKSRGITSELITYFDLGLAPNEYELLYKTLTDKDYLASDLVDLGLIKQGTNGFYDLFRERIIFPIHNEHNQVVAFSGRTYKTEDKNAKYINSPQTAVFTKSNVLYNLNRALVEVKTTQRLVLFEGYMDVIAAYKANIKDAVASMGTSLTRDQVRLLKRYTNNVTICYDGDSAGLDATLRAEQLLSNEGISVKIVLLPDNLDPDDYINQYSATQLEDFINNHWISSIQFRYYIHKKAVDFTKMLDIEQFKKHVFDLVKGESRTSIDVFLKTLSNDTNLSLESIRQDFQQYTKKDISKKFTKTQQPIHILSKFEKAEMMLLNYFLLDKKYFDEYQVHFQTDIVISKEVFSLQANIEDLYANENSVERFLETLNEPQLHFYNTVVKSKLVEGSDDEFHDLLDTMQLYRSILQSKDSEMLMKQAQTIEEKIKFAKERDKILKEAKHGQR